MTEAAFNIACMTIVALACFERIRTLGESHGHCEKWGYLILMGGCAGTIVEWWKPRGWDIGAESVVALGMALIALSILRPWIRETWASWVRGGK